MKRYLLLSLLSIFAVFASAQNIDSLLNELDKCIEQKVHFRAVRYHKIDSIQGLLSKDTNVDKEVLYSDLYNSFSHMQADSALYYLECLSELESVRTDKAKMLQVRTEIAVQYAIVGAYRRACDIVESIDPNDLSKEQRLHFFHVCRTIYGWVQQYLQRIPRENTDLQTKIRQYQDSIIAYETNELVRDVVGADIIMWDGNPTKAKDILLKCLSMAKNEYVAYCHFNLSMAYEQMDDTDNQLRHLAQAAICDLQRGVAEYAALPALAKLLNERGDYKRAYQYMICSMEDAGYCHAALRSLEIGEIYPIIEKVHNMHIANERKLSRYFSLGLAALAILLTIATVYLRKEAKALSKTKSQLAEANEQLESTNKQLESANLQLSTHNEQLTETNINLNQRDKIKEEYIALFISRCRKYITSLESYRRRLLKLAKSNQNSELMSTLKDDTLVEAEEERFYKDFDEAFLDIHPQFVQKFNDLLNDDSKFTLKKNELLNPELRIFALIRLGINDNKQIAEFLNYSMPTIYNYRSRIRSKSKYSKEEFDKKVMEL